MFNYRSKSVLVNACVFMSFLLPSSNVVGSATFTNIANDPIVGLVSYQRVPSARHETYRNFMIQSLDQPFSVGGIINTPMRHRGIPGVAVFDYDSDGDLDIYATNGPGAANSLFSNQLKETGELIFVDVAAEAGVQAIDQDSNGACYGDIDNDGDQDLMVVGHESGALLFENEAGSFTDISSSAGVDSGDAGMSCVMGDVNIDGKLDIFIARGYSLSTLSECFVDVFSSSIQANDLFLNNGDNRFSDISDTSGIRDLVSGGMPDGANTITWSGALVDYDQDGDLDLFTTDDQCNFPTSAFGGFSRGTMQLFQNDGAGNFSNHTFAAGLTLASEWMGTSWGDFNHDGALDFFVTSFGEWGKQFVGAPIALGDESSRWYLGDSNGAFIDPNLGELIYTPFGWGTVAEDFDNDGDTDISFFGGLDMLTLIEKSNPGAYLENEGNASFSYTASSLGLEHQRRNDSGAASGDFNADGYVDIVTVSNFNTPAPMPLVPYSVGGIDYGSPWDPAFFVPVTNATDSGFVWNGLEFPNGTLALQINDANSNYGSVTIRTMGTHGLTSNGRNNRDGIGAVLMFTPDEGKTAIKPVLGGSSHVSQNSLEQVFGLGSADRGVLDVLWPGGVKNRIYNVSHKQAVLMPEIPCSYADQQSMKEYVGCLSTALGELLNLNVITRQQYAYYFQSAVKAKSDYQKDR